MRFGGMPWLERETSSVKELPAVSVTAGKSVVSHTPVGALALVLCAKAPDVASAIPLVRAMAPRIECEGLIPLFPSAFFYFPRAGKWDCFRL